VEGVEGAEIVIAEAMDCEMSERKSEVRFWLLEKPDPHCNSSHFFPTLPTHEETTGGDAAAAASNPKPGMDDTGGNADAFMLALLLASRSRSTEGVIDTASIGETRLSNGKVRLELFLDLRRCAFVLLCIEPEGKQSGSVSKLE